MSDSSCGIRFPGSLNCDLRKLATNLILFYRLHFFVNSLFSKTTSPQIGPELVQTLLSPSNTLCSVDIRLGKTFTAAVIARGAVSNYEVENTLQQYSHKNSDFFKDWIPNNFTISMCKSPLRPQEVSGMCMNATTAIQTVFKHISEKFTLQLRRKAHLHWYTQHGMNEMEFFEAESNCNDLISEYYQYEYATPEVDISKYDIREEDDY